jgi:hypothetical protein
VLMHTLGNTFSVLQRMMLFHSLQMGDTLCKTVAGLHVTRKKCTPEW